MTARSNIEKWLIADWSTVQSKPVGCDVKEMATAAKNEENVSENIAHERPILEEQQQQRITKTKEDSKDQDENMPREAKDYSPSASSWAPSDEGSSSDESNTKKTRTKAIKMEKCARNYIKRRNGKNVPTPVHRPNAVVNVLKERQNNINNKMNNQSQGRKRKYKETHAGNKSLPDSAKKYLPPKDPVAGSSANSNSHTILQIEANFKEIFKIIHNMKIGCERHTNKYPNVITAVVPLKESAAIEPIHNNAHEQTERSQSEESNRSDDNVLITNKYTTAVEPPDGRHQIASQNEVEEWVPIGSGKTMIHKDKFRKVNWRSYTIATRTLLMATFPRRVLATHSLTGKRSPAFQNKPAKMCLDPKIVSDIIIEITSKFNVKENLVRGAITTKCADECKMYRTRTQNKKKLLKNLEKASPALKKGDQEIGTVKAE